MTMFKITSIYAGLLALMMVFLAARVVRLRRTVETIPVDMWRTRFHSELWENTLPRYPQLNL